MSGRVAGKRGQMIDVEVGRTPTGNRSFPIAFKVEFIRQWDDCTEWGAKTALLREYNLPKSTVKSWLRSRDNGTLTAAMVKAADKSRFKMENRERAELARLRTENDQLKKKVAQSEAVQEILGKAYELLEGMTTSSDEGPDIPVSLMSATEYASWLHRKGLS